MGFVHADITLVNSFDATAFQMKLIPESEIKKIELRALVDTGADMLMINDSIKNQLDLQVRRKASIELADGSCVPCEVVGPVDLHFKNRMTSVQALVVPGATDVLIGVIPLEGLDVIIDPLKQELALPPERPYLARAFAR